MLPTTIIRPFAPADRQAVRDICVATCWMGEYRPEVLPDDWIWAEHWTRYFTDKRSDCTFVTCIADAPTGEAQYASQVGYLTGTPDAREFDRYGAWLVPGIVGHVISRRLLRQRVARKAIAMMLRSMIRGELSVPRHVVRKFPATAHVDLLPAARGTGA